MTRRAVPNTFGFDISGLGFFRRIEDAQTFGYAMSVYARFKTMFSLRHTEAPRTVSAVRRNLILNVFGGRNISEIFQPVVVWFSVNVVDVIFWPSAVFVKPNQSMRPIALPVESNNAIAKIIYRPRNAANHYSSVTFDAPAQSAGCGVVTKQFFQPFISKHMQSPMVLSCVGKQFMSMVKAP